MNHFDSMAKNFDTGRRMERSRLIAEEFRKHIQDGGAKSALEYGCGTGLVGLELADAFGRLLLVDSSPGMITQVEGKLAELGNPAISALCADFTEAAPVGLRVDCIFMSLVLHHIRDTEGILRRFYDALNDGGHLLVADLNADDGSFHADAHDYDGHNGFDAFALTELCKKTGFKDACVKTFYHNIRHVNGQDVPYSLFVLDAVR